MKSAIIKIDRAIKAMNHLDHPHRAEDFLMMKSISSLDHKNSMLILVPQPQEEGEEALEVGIYLNQNTRDTLEEIPGEFSEWTHEQLKAFSVAVEEISHFHLLLHRALTGGAVSHFELELQGEIDVFFLNYFSALQKLSATDAFSHLYEKLFENFRLRSGMPDEEKTRYEDAISTARNFVVKLKPQMMNGDIDGVLRRIRLFYRKGISEKISNSKS